MVRIIPMFRRLCLDYRALARVMFSRPFQDFDPGPAELPAAPSVREVLIGKGRRCVDAGALVGRCNRISRTYCSLWHRVWQYRTTATG